MADFSPPIITIVGLARFDLPGHTIMLADGGFVDWGSDRYAGEDGTFGTIESVEAFSEAVGDEAPAGRLTFLPKSTAAAATLSQAQFQGSRLRFWLGRVDPMTGQLVGDPEPVADCLLDTTALRVGKSTRVLEMDFVSRAERLFIVSEGNVLSDTFHTSIWPGESGMANTTGIGGTVAWGTDAPVRGTSSGGAYAISGGGGSGGGGRHVQYV